MSDYCATVISRLIVPVNKLRKFVVSGSDIGLALIQLMLRRLAKIPMPAEVPSYRNDVAVPFLATRTTFRWN